MFGFGRKKTGAAAPAADAARIDSPARGRILPLAEVPDPVFSGGLVGPGFAVDLEEGEVRAPVAGTVVMVPETLHAVGIRAAGGAEVLVHVGVDSVTLKGEGFTARCAVGDRVEAGQVLLELDLGLLRERIPSTITPVVVSNADGYEVEGPMTEAPGGRGVLLVRPR